MRDHGDQILTELLVEMIHRFKSSTEVWISAQYRVSKTTTLPAEDPAFYLTDESSVPALCHQHVWTALTCRLLCLHISSVHDNKPVLKCWWLLVFEEVRVGLRTQDGDMFLIICSLFIQTKLLTIFHQCLKVSVKLDTTFISLVYFENPLFSV